jgi:hypothetical protein
MLPACLENLPYLQLLSRVKLEQLTTLEFIKLPNNNIGGQIPPPCTLSFKLFYLEISLYPSGNKESWASL